jgi:phosphocarrier protein HPr
MLMEALVSSRSAEVKRVAAPSHVVHRTFVVNLLHGLHARPCAMLVKGLQSYKVVVQVEANGEAASGKSILGLMSLAAGHGARISFSMTGEDALSAMAEVERLFQTNFSQVQ